ncbi:MAG: M23 family metallopeptidase [Bdellovibrionaceae bacterium]|nr:M23 family metallopeptidase [Pseudobdellovibrionaceae bacterium]
MLAFGICGCYQNAFAADNSFSPKKIRLGDTVVSILRRHGFSLKEREQVLRSSEALHSFLLTTEMSYFLSTAHGKTALRMHDHEQNLVFNVEKSPHGLSVKTTPAKYLTEVQLIKGKVRGSLMASIFSQVKSNWIASRFMDAYILEHDLERIPAGAPFWLKLEKQYDGPHFVGYGEVLQTSLELGGEQIRKDFIRMAKGGVFVNAEDLLSDRPFYAPVGYVRIASLFQKGRRHPITRKVQSHLGIDFEAPPGSPIYAPQRGMIARMGRNRAAGNYVILRHPNGIETAYNHLRTLPKDLKTGSFVRVGQKIGEIGCTGYCTKAHLHFAIKKNGRMVDPAKYLKAFPSHFEEALQKKVAHLD